MTYLKIGHDVYNIDHWVRAGAGETDKDRVVDFTGLDAAEMEAALERLLRPAREPAPEPELPPQSWRDRPPLL
jgi:hypothetical protein